MLCRTDIINNLIEKNGFKTYLEIGLDNPFNNFVEINCLTKHSVDPFIVRDNSFDFIDCGKSKDDLEEEIKRALPYLTFRTTSDDFFEKTSLKYDIIFIDGLHTERQCGKDIINGLKHLNEGGYIIVHDCLPSQEVSQIIPRKVIEWNGDVWKCIPELNKQFIGYDVVDCDFGCGVIKYTPDWKYLHYLDKSIYEWNDFEKNRDKLMHVISEQEFLEKYIYN